MNLSERIILAHDRSEDDDDESEDDLYQGYNDFNPVLDTRNLQEDDLFRETVHKSSYGNRATGRATGNRTLGTGNGRAALGSRGLRTGNASSTAGMAFSRGTAGGMALKSRRNGRATGNNTGNAGIQNPPGARPMTAVKGAGYSSHGPSGGGIFDPLGLGSGGNNQGVIGLHASGFHLADESTPEHKIRQLEQQIGRLLEQSVAAADRTDHQMALDLAKDCVAKERSLNRLKEQSNLTEQFGPNTDLTFAAIFNLAEQYSNARLWPEAINTLQSILKNRAFTNTGTAIYTQLLCNYFHPGRLRMNIGEIHFRQGQYPKAIKFFRMALDQVPAGQTELRLKLMQNIGLAFVRLTQYADAIAAFEFIASERGDLDPGTAFHLIVCYYAMGDADKMKYYFGKLLACRVEDQFEERYGHHEILTNGGNIFASTGTSGSAASNLGGGGGYDSPLIDRATPSGGGFGEPSTTFGAQPPSTRGRLGSPVLMIRDEHDHHQNLLIEAIRGDPLRQLEKSRIRQAEWAVLTAAKLIAPYIESPGVIESAAIGGHGGVYDVKTTNTNTDLGGNSASPSTSVTAVGAGYDWCLDQIRKMANAVAIGSVTTTTTNSANGGGSAISTQPPTSALNFTNLADELELYKAVKHLRSRQFDQAIGTLKRFETRDRLLPVVRGQGSLEGSSAISTGGGSGGSSGFGSGSGDRKGASPITSGVGGGGGGYFHPIGSSSITPTTGGRLGATTAGHSRVAATAATNLSFLYLLQQELEVAGRYADEAIAADRYCTGALLNRGNVYFYLGDHQRALDYYRDVLHSSPACLEAHYNQALADRKLGNHDRALEALFRLRTLSKVPSGSGNGGHHHQQQYLLNQKISNTVEVNLLYQIASIYEAMDNLDQATDFYQQVLNVVPTDVTLLIKMADLATDANDRKQALSYLMEAYRYLPSNVPTLERLAAYYIEVKMYEKAIKYLEQLASNQPGQIKWQLMIAASYRRAGNYQSAFSQYQTIHGRFPDNVDCLKFLVRICAELDAEGRTGIATGTGGKSYGQLADQYAESLKRLEKARELREQQQLVAQQSNSRAASRAREIPGTASGNQRLSSREFSSRPDTGLRLASASNGVGAAAASRHGSAATSSASSGNSVSSGYVTSKTPNTKSPVPSGGRVPSGGSGGGGGGGDGNGGQLGGNSQQPLNRSSISAIVDQVVEQLDANTLNDRPTTSWGGRNGGRFRSATSRAGSVGGGGGTDGGVEIADGRDRDNYDEDDLLLDANLDDILPD